jgi:hypothetical protein
MNGGRKHRRAMSQDTSIPYYVDRQEKVEVDRSEEVEENFSLLLKGNSTHAEISQNTTALQGRRPSSFLQGLWQSHSHRLLPIFENRNLNEKRVRMMQYSMAPWRTFLSSTATSSSRSTVSGATSIALAASPSTTTDIMPFYRQPIHYKNRDDDEAYLYGYALLYASLVSFIFVLYTVVVAKFMPVTQVAVRDR